MRRDFSLYLDDMLDAIQKIEKYSKYSDYASFNKDEQAVEAVCDLYRKGYILKQHFSRFPELHPAYRPRPGNHSGLEFPPYIYSLFLRLADAQ